ncbi:MAG: PASTA domain-containing protein [bacterium]
MKKYVLMGIEIGITLFFVILLSYFMFNWLMNKVIHSKQEVFVPDVQGESLAKALDMLSEQDLALKKVGEEFNSSLPAKSVIRQNPLPGVSIRKDRAVKVVLSIGGEVEQVPDLIGKSLREAEIELRQIYLTLGEISYKYSLIFKKDEIVSHDPPPGSITDKGYLVNIVISRGMPPDSLVLMPDFSTKKISEAKIWAEQKSIKIDSIIEDYDSVANKDVIIEQEPKPDTVITEKGKINFVVGTRTEVYSNIGDKYFEYEVPKGSDDRKIKIVLKDENREKVLFQGKKNSGAKIKIPYNSTPNARIRVFVNGMLVDERSVE